MKSTDEIRSMSDRQLQHYMWYIPTIVTEFWDHASQIPTRDEFMTVESAQDLLNYWECDEIDAEDFAEGMNLYIEDYARMCENNDMTISERIESEEEEDNK